MAVGVHYFFRFLFHSLENKFFIMLHYFSILLVCKEFIGS